MDDPKIVTLNQSNLDEKIIQGINTLLLELAHNTSAKVDMKSLVDYLSHGLMIHLCVINSEVVGMACCMIIRKPLEIFAQLEDIVVSERFRKRGLARKLIRSIATDIPKECKKLYAVSGNSRPEAHSMYVSMGFDMKDSSVFYSPLPLSRTDLDE